MRNVLKQNNDFYSKLVSSLIINNDGDYLSESIKFISNFIFFPSEKTLRDETRERFVKYNLLSAISSLKSKNYLGMEEKLMEFEKLYEKDAPKEISEINNTSSSGLLVIDSDTNILGTDTLEIKNLKEQLRQLLRELKKSEKELVDQKRINEELNETIKNKIFLSEKKDQGKK